MQIAPDGRPVASDKGKDVRIWRRDAGGSWKMIIDIWNTDLPPV